MKKQIIELVPEHSTDGMLDSVLRDFYYYSCPSSSRFTLGNMTIEKAWEQWAEREYGLTEDQREHLTLLTKGEYKDLRNGH